MEGATAKTGPLGYLSLGVALVAVGLFHAGFFEFSALPLIIALIAGTSLLLATTIEARSGQRTELAAFGLLGMFWISQSAIWAVDLFAVQPPLDRQYVGWYLGLWSVIGAVLLAAHRRRGLVVRVVLALVTVWFVLNAAAEFTGGPIVTQMAGFEGLISGLLSMYLGAALLINEGAMREVLPLGEPRLSKIIIPDDISQLFD